MEKIFELNELSATLDELKGQGNKIVHCHGVFDLIHIGHVRYLEEAKEFGDILLVTITEDKNVKKGPNRPAFTETLRAEALAALEIVDYVAINKWETAVETINLLKPDFYVKGPDYKDPKNDLTGKIDDEAQAVENVGGEIRFTSGITFSSTNLLNTHFQVFNDEQ